MYFHYLTVSGGNRPGEKKSPLLLKWLHIGAKLAIFKGVICDKAKILGAVLAPLNSKVAPAFSKLTLHMVQFGPYNWVDLTFSTLTINAFGT